MLVLEGKVSIATTCGRAGRALCPRQTQTWERARKGGGRGEAAGRPGLGSLRKGGSGQVQGSARQALPLPVAPPVQVSWGRLEVGAVAGGAVTCRG